MDDFERSLLMIDFDSTKRWRSFTEDNDFSFVVLYDGDNSESISFQNTKSKFVKLGFLNVVYFNIKI